MLPSPTSFIHKLYPLSWKIYSVSLALRASITVVENTMFIIKETKVFSKASAFFRETYSFLLPRNLFLLFSVKLIPSFFRETYTFLLPFYIKICKNKKIIAYTRWGARTLGHRITLIRANGYIRKCLKVLRSTNWANRVCLDAGTSHLIFIYPYSAILPTRR